MREMLGLSEDMSEDGVRGDAELNCMSFKGKHFYRRVREYTKLEEAK